jgi:hypothetical protein
MEFVHEVPDDSIEVVGILIEDAPRQPEKRDFLPCGPLPGYYGVSYSVTFRRYLEWEY